jgi:hypothetical protein
MADNEDVTKYRCTIDSLGRYCFYFNDQPINVREIEHSIRMQLRWEKQPAPEFSQSTQRLTYLNILPMDLRELLLYYIKEFTLLLISNDPERLFCGNSGQLCRPLDDKFWKSKTLSDFKSFPQKKCEFYNNKIVTRENFRSFKHFATPDSYVQSFEEFVYLRDSAITSLNDYEEYLYEFLATELSWKEIYTLFTHSKNMNKGISENILHYIKHDHFLKNSPVIIDIILKIASERISILAEINNPESIKYVWTKYPQYQSILISTSLLSHPEVLSEFAKDNPEITISVESLAKIFAQLGIHKYISVDSHLHKITL